MVAKAKKKATKKRRPVFRRTKAAPVANRVLVLRTCDKDLRSYGGFQWPESGPVEAPDWSPVAECGHGLHGLLWGEGASSLLKWNADAKWLVVAVDAATIVDLGGKVKFPRGEVVFCGERGKAGEYVWSNGGGGKKIAGATLTGGYGATLIGGYGATLTGGYGATLTGGDRATLTGGYEATLTGGYGATLTGGNRATITGGDEATLTGGYGATLTGGYRATLTGGYRATLTGGYGATLTGGDRATLTGGDGATLTGGNGATLTGGYGATLTGGNMATLFWKWFDGIKTHHALAVVGENGIKAKTPYTVRDGVIVEVEQQKLAA
jgi:hypothetical protein